MNIRNMITKYTLILLIAVLVLAASGCTNKNTINATSSVLVKGSDTVLPLSQAEAEEYMILNPDSDITIIGGGSGVGITALIDGDTDIAMASREMKDAEISTAQQKGVDPIETTIAHDGIAVIVNPANPVDRLTFTQVRGIFNGTISNWKEVGGSDLQITVISRDSSSGTYEYFKENVLEGDDYRQDALTQAATGAIVQSVSQNKGAIGYVGLAYLNPSTKAVELSIDGTKFVIPTIANVKSGEYPLSRALYYYTNGQPKGAIADFINYVLSAEGQTIVEDVGYIPIR